LGDLKGKRKAGSPETGGVATPLVDATVRFCEEFIIKEGSPSTQQPAQQSAGERLRNDKETKNNLNSFEPTYLYDAMKEKQQLKHLLKRRHYTVDVLHQN
jgi:hypothetical protein